MRPEYMSPEELVEHEDTDWPDLIQYAEHHGEIPACFRDLEPTLHFCAEWDQMVICEHMPEFEACRCSP